MFLRLVICVTLINLSGFAQAEHDDFVLARDKPWAYLRLDHVGPRKPVFAGEPETGIWLRLVNNCHLPIMLLTLGDDSKNPGVVVLDEVVPIDVFTISGSAPLGPPRQSDRPKPPAGYWGRGADLLHVATVSPGEDLLFSVPRNHVSELWNLRLQFSLKVGNSSVPTGPVCYVEFYESEIPKNSPIKMPLSPRGPRPPSVVELLHKKGRLGFIAQSYGSSWGTGTVTSVQLAESTGSGCTVFISHEEMTLGHRPVTSGGWKDRE
jgi:hypothetical protein